MGGEGGLAATDSQDALRDCVRNVLLYRCQKVFNCMGWNMYVLFGGKAYQVEHCRSDY